jgi:hypothetical protein
LFGGAICNGVAEADRPGIVEYANEFDGYFEKVRTGDLSLLGDLYVAQALTLDGIFTEMARRAAVNMGQSLVPTEIYMRLALKAQAQSRATLDALAKLHQPREQTVRHVHVNEGGQAIVAEEFHAHTGGPGNGKAVKQSHEPSGAAPGCAALLGKDEAGDGMPVPDHQRPEEMSPSRRQSRRA